MSFIDVLIPLVVGLLLVARPQAFFKKGGPPVEVVTRSAKLRKIGYLLLGVALLFFVIALVGRHAP